MVLREENMKYFKRHSMAEAYNHKKFGNLYDVVRPSIFHPDSKVNKSKKYAVFK